ncbi:MAG: efflux transporter outer membrane subunit [Burkholderiaceae bacterium]|nr:efflux transporter outer membrane subunit [Burkholderiaceae bacterium]
MEMLANVKQSDARKASAEEELLALDEQIALQRNRIAALLGAGPDRGLRITRPTINLAKSFGLPQQMQLELLGRRPDIVAARLRVEAYEKNIEKQKAEFYPNVNLSAMIGVQSLGLNMLTKSGSDIGSIGPAISLPIFNGGRLRGMLHSAQAEHDEAIGNYNLAVTQALQEVADATVSQKSLTQQIEKLQQAFQAASEAHRIMKNRYRGGLSNYLDVLSAEEALLGSQRALRDMQSRSFTQDVALIKALGGGYQAPAKN